MVLYRNTLKYMFSIVQANCPTRPVSMSVAHMRAEILFIPFTSCASIPLSAAVPVGGVSFQPAMAARVPVS